MNFTTIGGTPNYTYKWAHSSGNPKGTFPNTTNNNVSNLPSGNYNVEVIDNNGCKSNKVMAIKEPPALSIVHSTRSTGAVNGNGGYIYIYPSGGVPQYTFNWLCLGSEPGFPMSHSNLLQDQATSLHKNTYLINIIDANGCMINDTVSIADSGSIYNAIVEIYAHKILIFPNPSNGSFSISGIPLGTYSIINPFGQTLRRLEIKQNNATPLKIEGLEAGEYFLINNQNEEKVKKIIVVK
jgi:hypothetical protein